VIPVDIVQGQSQRDGGPLASGGLEGRAMWDLVRRVEGMGPGVASGGQAGQLGQTNGDEFEQRQRSRESVGFAAKVIGIGVFAGLMLTYCNALIDACFRGLH
jgi:hypothetical protein